MLWIELDEAFDTLRLNRHLEPQGVQIAVGSIFPPPANTATACASTMRLS